MERAAQQQESEEKTIKFPEEQAATIARLILWMYYGQIPIFLDSPIFVRDAETMSRNAINDQVFTRSESPTLRDLLEQDPEAFEEVDWGHATQKAPFLYNMTTILALYNKSYEYDIPKLRDHVMSHLMSLVSGRPQVFWAVKEHAHFHTANPVVETKLLDDLVYKIMIADLKILRKEERFQTLLEDDPKLTLKLFHELAEQREASEDAEKASLEENQGRSNKRPRNRSVYS